LHYGHPILTFCWSVLLQEEIAELVILNNWSMRYSELEKILFKNGWTKKSKTKHDWFSKPGCKSFPVPRHPSKEVPNGTLNAILKQAGLK
jgi:mRNA interferase HicA